MTCHYCDGVGYTVDDDFDARRPCPVCTADDLDSYRVRSLVTVMRAVDDAVRETLAAHSRCECGAELDVPASKCQACWQRERLSVVPD